MTLLIKFKDLRQRRKRLCRPPDGGGGYRRHELQSVPIWELNLCQLENELAFFLPDFRGRREGRMCANKKSAAPT